MNNEFSQSLNTFFSLVHEYFYYVLANESCGINHFDEKCNYCHNRIVVVGFVRKESFEMEKMNQRNTRLSYEVIYLGITFHHALLLNNYILTGFPLIIHWISAAGFDAFEVQLTLTVSPTEYRSFPPVIFGPSLGRTAIGKYYEF